MDAALQVLKAGGIPLRVERDDLAVENERRLPPALPAPQRIDDFRKLRALLVAETRPEADAAIRELDDRANAVVFRFVDEIRIVERRRRRRREHRLEHLS